MYYRHKHYRNHRSNYTLGMQRFLENLPITVQPSLASSAQRSCGHVDGPSDKNTDHAVGPPYKRV
jgi:hypothetical protein